MKDYSDEKLVEMVKGGNDAAFQEISDRFKKTVIIKASAYFIEGGDRDDLIQEGMIGLFKAVRDFDGSKNILFRTFAGVCIDRQLVSAVRKASSSKNRPLNESVPIPEVDYARTPEMVTSVEEIVFGKINARENLEKLRATLSEQENRVLTHMLKGENYREIAEAAGMGEKAADNAIQRIKRKAKDVLGVELRVKSEK